MHSLLCVFWLLVCRIKKGDQNISKKIERSISICEAPSQIDLKILSHPCVILRFMSWSKVFKLN